MKMILAASALAFCATSAFAQTAAAPAPAPATPPVASEKPLAQKPPARHAQFKKLVSPAVARVAIANRAATQVPTAQAFI